MSVFIWNALSLSTLSTPAIGLLVIAYLILIRRKSNNIDDKSLAGMNPLSLSILIALVLLLISITGLITSPLYFLLYFIPFAITFVLLPPTTFVFLAGCILLFFSSALEANVTENLIKLGSLMLITPLAYFFGKEYRLVEAHAQHDTEVANQISQEAANVLADQAQSMPTKDKQQLADIISRTDELRNE